MPLLHRHRVLSPTTFFGKTMVGLPLTLFRWRIESRAASLARNQHQQPLQPLPVQQPQVKQQKCTSILDLPLEVQWNILERLSLASRTVVGQTCRRLRQITKSDGPGLARPIELNQDRYEFLMLISRSLPDKYVCMHCRILHRVRTKDTPRARYNYSGCPHIVDSRSTPPLANRPASLQYRHVQLALKYARTRDPEYADYLQALTAFTTECPAAWDYKIKYEAEARIVPDPADDGRLHYLLASSWVIPFPFHRTGYPDELSISACPHLRFLPDHRAARRVEQPNDLIVALQRCTSYWPEDVDAAVAVAYRGSCARCAADFEVRRHNAAHVSVRVWTDLGPEISPIDVRWTANIYTYESLPRHPVVHHLDGSARALYGPDDAAPGAKPESASQQQQQQHVAAQEDQSQSHTTQPTVTERQQVDIQPERQRHPTEIREQRPAVLGADRHAHQPEWGVCSKMHVLSVLAGALLTILIELVLDYLGPLLLLGISCLFMSWLLMMET
ncbi:hypothetical protein GGR53DRAFT_476622 [Hypoxylon sp. FL1150]|nr:hypothetical protein GGR53DRAFT_476622 [Hypoxylon sp. FL1150]